MDFISIKNAIILNLYNKKQLSMIQHVGEIFIVSFSFNPWIFFPITSW